jgi:hypothetical protein
VAVEVEGKDGENFSKRPTAVSLLARNTYLRNST